MFLIILKDHSKPTLKDKTAGIDHYSTKKQKILNDKHIPEEKLKEIIDKPLIKLFESKTKSRFDFANFIEEFASW